MNKELQIEIANILQKSADTMGDGINFFNAKLPDIANEFLINELMTQGIVISVFFIVLYLFCKDFKTIEFNNFPQYLFQISIGTLAAIMLIGAIKDFLKILMTPKIYLLEYAAGIC
jgi:hypothetical protein